MERKITREQFVEAWRGHIIELAGLALQAPGAYSKQELDAYYKIRSEGFAMVDRIAVQIYGQPEGPVRAAA
jgi:hypothetical protein